ncbi:MAG: molybdopterin cofactor-binding domain-containing protein [Desulfuromonadales bacterium]
MKTTPFNYIGKPHLRIDGVAKVTGDAQYTDDIHLPGTLVGKMLRSPHAHALIRNIDVSKALALPGVKAIVLGKDAPILFGILPRAEDENALAIDKVRYVGEPVAGVAAFDERTALEALKLIEVEYELLPAILDPHEALTREDVKIHHFSEVANIERRATLEFGNVDEGFAAADYIREDTFYKGAITHAPIETHVALANYRDGKMTLWTTTQVPHYVHKALSRVLEMPMDRIRVIKPTLGGGFGGKGEPFSFEFVACLLSRKCGRPVKIVHTREEVFMTHRGRHPMHMKLRTGVKKDGTITALEFHNLLDGGSYGSYGLVTLYYSGQLLTLPYILPAYRFDGVRVFTNKPACGALRGHGGVGPRFAFEVHLDRIAADLGLDPLEIRQKNSLKANTMTLNDLRITSCGFEECLEKAGKAIGWEEKRGKLPRGRGVGLAGGGYVSGANNAIYFNPMPHSSVNISVDRGGGVTVFCGASDIGQGSDTMLALVAGEILGISPALIRVISADTDTTPVDLGSYSSRVTFMAGNACRTAALAVREKIGSVVAAQLGVPKESVVIADGIVSGQGYAGMSFTFAQAVVLAESQGMALYASGGYTPPKLGGKYRGAGVGPSPAYSFGAHAAEVQVDEETGIVTVLRLVAAHDLGRTLNPLAAEGQVEGAVANGLGEVLMESHTNTGSGQHSCPSLLEYKIPTMLDLPDIEPILVESFDPEGPFGAKECGEGSLGPSIPAVVNAIYDAVGIWLHDAPITPEAVLAALKKERMR